MNEREEVEIKLLNDYLDGALKAKEDVGHKIALYEKQLLACKQQGLNFNVAWCESMVYYLKANAQLRNEGFLEKSLRDTARQSSGFDGIAPALLAKGSENGRIREAISLLNQAISIYDDDVDYWFLRASLYKILKNKQAARRDVEHILATYSEDQKVYLEARKLKDEIESIKDDRCFIATAVYGSTESAEVNVLRDYRDRVLLKSTMGRVLISSYYFVSPYIAQVVSKSTLLKALTRVLLLEPVIRFIAKRQAS
jgi:tetratricopeptide (TPR) repeat protein